MNDDDFAGIKAGLEDAIAFARGDATRGRVARSVDIRSIRGATKLSQAKFADAYGLDARALQDWEQGRRIPDRAAQTYLRLIAADPARIRALVATAAE